MKKKISYSLYMAIVFSLLISMSACEEEETADNTDTGVAETQEGVDVTEEIEDVQPEVENFCLELADESILADGITHDLFAAGTWPNTLIYYEDALYIVNSGDNTVSKTTLSGDFNTVADFVNTGEGANPYEVAFWGTGNDGRIYVTNMMTNSVVIASLSDGSIIDKIEHESFSSPSDVLVTEDYLLVTNINYGTGRLEEGSLTVFDRKDLSFINNIPSTQKNPQFMTIYNDRLYLVNSGVTFNPTTYDPEVQGDSGIDIFILETLGTASAPDNNIVIPKLDSDLMLGAPGEVVVSADKKFGYMGSGLSPILFKIDLEAETLINGPENPIVLFDGGGESHLVSPYILPDGMALVLAFNNDEMIIVDTLCDEVLGSVSLGTNSEMLEGPFRMAIVPDSPITYILQSASSEVLSFDSSLL